jgi:hypothetical protein
MDCDDEVQLFDIKKKWMLVRKKYCESSVSEISPIILKINTPADYISFLHISEFPKTVLRIFLCPFVIVCVCVCGGGGGQVWT